MSAAQYCSDMPDEFPGTQCVDRFVGQFLRRLHRMTVLLDAKVSSASENDRCLIEGWWARRSDETYGEMQSRIAGPLRLDEERCESMDRIRDHAVHFSGAYSGTVYDYLDLIDAISRVEEMIAYLEGSDGSPCTGPRRPGGDDDDLRRGDIADALRRCCAFDGGWYRLSEVGMVLRRANRKIGHLSDECERLGFDVMKRPGGGILGSFDVYIRPRASAEDRSGIQRRL